ncbi:MAG TPA: GntR family transcriptional regulator [Bauldia sp.]|nr:GntR family transcriptional regulator [Bauldia sp.]
MSLTREALDRIRSAIVSGDLEFGEQLSETQIAKALGMSKAPVRAAFIELKDKGLVTIVPQSGTYVFSPSAEDVRTLSHFRALLEHEALSEAMKHRAAQLLTRLDDAIARMKRALATKNYDAYGKADNSYHIAILEESGNRYLLNAYHLGATALEALRVRLQKAGGFRERSFDEHVEMAELLRNGRVSEAQRLMRTHILVINDSLATLPLTPKSPRREQSTGRDYGVVFGKAPSRNGRGGRRSVSAPSPARRAAS